MVTRPHRTKGSFPKPSFPVRQDHRCIGIDIKERHRNGIPHRWHGQYPKDQLHFHLVRVPACYSQSPQEFSCGLLGAQMSTFHFTPKQSLSSLHLSPSQRIRSQPHFWNAHLGPASPHLSQFLITFFQRSQPQSRCNLMRIPSPSPCCSSKREEKRTPGATPQLRRATRNPLRFRIQYGYCLEYNFFASPF